MTDPKPAADTKPQFSENTYFFLVSDDHEFAIAKAYILERYPGSKAKLVRELREDRLTDRHTVIALRRDDERSPVVELLPGPTGQKVHKHVPPKDLINEIREGKPVRVADFWRQGGDGEGELDPARFKEALGLQSVPATLKNYPIEKTIRLSYA